MAILIGVDEAGYGPNLGPLAIGLSAWTVPQIDGCKRSTRSQQTLLFEHDTDASRSSLATSAPLACNLYEHLASAITAQPDGKRLVIADSKAVYKANSGFDLLERTVLAAASEGVSDWNSLVEHLGADPGHARTELPWHEGFNPHLPVTDAAESIALARELIATSTTEANVQSHGIRARLVFPSEFNSLSTKLDSKGAALSFWTLELVRKSIDEILACDNRTTEPIVITCDKHGGRNRYRDVVADCFGVSCVNVLEESRPVSRYRLEYADATIEIVFRSKGENCLETALASMTAKYLRELAMRALNAFWCEKLADLEPTAGYPVDALRYRTAIEPLWKRHRIAEPLIWRSR